MDAAITSDAIVCRSELKVGEAVASFEVGVVETRLEGACGANSAGLEGLEGVAAIGADAAGLEGACGVGAVGVVGVVGAIGAIGATAVGLTAACCGARSVELGVMVSIIV